MLGANRLRIRCFNINQVPVWLWIGLVLILAAAAVFFIRNRKLKNYA